MGPCTYLHLWKCQDRGCNNKTIWRKGLLRGYNPKAFQYFKRPNPENANACPKCDLAGYLSMGDGIGRWVCQRHQDCHPESDPSAHGQRWCCAAQELWMELGEEELTEQGRVVNATKALDWLVSESQLGSSWRCKKRSSGYFSVFLSFTDAVKAVMQRLKQRTLTSLQSAMPRRDLTVLIVMVVYTSKCHEKQCNTRCWRAGYRSINTCFSYTDESVTLRISVLPFHIFFLMHEIFHHSVEKKMSCFLKKEELLLS